MTLFEVFENLEKVGVLGEAYMSGPGGPIVLEREADARVAVVRSSDAPYTRTTLPLIGWQRVRRVEFGEAMEAWAEGKTIRTTYPDGAGDTYLSGRPTLTVTQETVKERTWYIVLEDNGSPVFDEYIEESVERHIPVNDGIPIGWAKQEDD